jgi:molybdate transport system substrate-binding protein
MSRRAWKAGAGLLAAIAMLSAPTVAPRAESAELKVLSAGAVKKIVSELAEDFQRESGHTVTIASGTAGQLRDKVAQGEAADVVIVTDTALEQLQTANAVITDTRADIARTGVGVAVREGAPRPDISTPEHFKEAVLAAKSIVYTDPSIGATSGIHVAGLLQRLGIAEAVKPKTVLWPGGYAAEALVKGQADLCIHQISEIMPVKGVTLVGPLPRELQKITTYSAAVPTKASAPELGRAFIAFLTRPAFKAKFEAAGLDYRQ